MIALNDLNLDHLFIITPGDKQYLLEEKITACGLDAFSFV